MGQAAVKPIRVNSDAVDVYRSSAGLNIANSDSANVLGSYAELMKNNVVVTTETTFVEQFYLPISLPGDDNY
jgi:hypothetical protein